MGPPPEADGALARVGRLSLEVIVADEGRELGGVLAGEVGPGMPDWRALKRETAWRTGVGEPVNFAIGQDLLHFA